MDLRQKSPIPDLIADLEKAITGEVAFDLASRLLYSTDASLYQIEPLGVVFPRTLDELSAVVEIAADHQVPLLARGAGSSLAGQAVGNALVIDCSRYLDHIIEINPQEKTAKVQPGVIMSTLNQQAAQFGLQFGPDPASAERATMGGSIASNASGAHSIEYGMTADHLHAVDVILADGSHATFETISLPEARRRAGLKPPTRDSRNTKHATHSLESNLYRSALHIRDQYAQAIRQNWPRTWRRASGYNLNYLLPWSPASPAKWFLGDGANSAYPPAPSGFLNLAPLIAGSEGTLAVIRQATVRLVSIPKKTVLGVLAYPSLAAACDAVPELLQSHPSAIELISRSLIQLARSVPAYAHQISFLDPISVSGIDPAAILVVEFAGDDLSNLLQRAKRLGKDVLIAESYADQMRVWGVRKMGLGILLSRPGEPKPVPFIEDMSVPVERLGEFVREIEGILQSHGTQGDFYGHASAGCLHIRPLLNLKRRQGVEEMLAIAEESTALCIELGGAVTGEHGDGLVRSQWILPAYGPEIVSAFRDLKQAADPQGILNPGKLPDAPPMTENLRYGPDYAAHMWVSNLDFSRQAGLDGAIEMCNGAGVCRKAGGVMCPSYQVTADEMHSTRGRANLLRAMISGRFPDEESAEETVYAALDLCLACKGCKAECPSSVDMAKLKYEFLDYYYGSTAHRHYKRSVSDYLFSYIEPVGRWGRRFAPLANALLRSNLAGRLGERLFGLAHQRKLPSLQRRSLHDLISKRKLNGVQLQGSKQHAGNREVDCLFLSDPFTEYFQPEIALAAMEILTQWGCSIQVLPVVGTGRTLLSKGFIDPARRQAIRVLEAIDRADPCGKLPVIGVEPSEIYTLRDEYRDLLPADERVERLATRAFMLDEFVVRPDKGNLKRSVRIANSPQAEKQQKILLHGHCYQKTQPPAADGYPTGVAATVQMLTAVGYEVEVVQSGCCGMAGAFGYEAEHYEISMQIGEQALFPAVRKALKENPRAIIAAPGVSCRSQIEDGTGVAPLHPIILVYRLINPANAQLTASGEQRQAA